MKSKVQTTLTQDEYDHLIPMKNDIISKITAKRQ